MTNFDPIKDKIWKAAQKQNKTQFDKECTNLMKKAVGDWWRVGWNIMPADADELAKMLQQVAKRAHREWLKAMKRGDAPNEDVSPGEGFALCAQIIKNLQDELKEAKKNK